MGISTWTARAAATSVALAGGLLCLVAAPPGTAAATPAVADGALAVGGAVLADPDGSGSAMTIGPGTDPAWSPDGTRLATVRDFTSRDIWITDLDGRTTSLQAPDAFDRLNGVAWTDPDTLAMVSGDGTVWTMRADGTGATQVYDLSSRFTSDYFTYVRLEGSRGERLLIAHRTSVTGDELLLLDLGTEEVTSLVPEADDRYVNDAAFTADGEHVTYLSGGRLHDVPVTGGTPTAVLPDLPVYGFDWSPDGGSLAYVVPADHRVRVHDLASGEDHEATWTYAADVAWQPVGTCTVTGTDGDDELVGSPGDDVICAGAGDDVVTASAGRDVVVGGPGSDRMDYSGSPDALDYDGRRLVGRAAGRTEVLSLEAVTGTGLGDVIRGSAGDDVIEGGPGDDVLGPGDGGADSLSGGPGSDTLDLALGTGTGTGSPPARAVGYSFTVNLAEGSLTDNDPAGRDSLSSLENVSSNPGVAGLVIGDEGPNVLDTGGTWTTVEGLGGDDTFVGGGIVSYESAPGPVTVDVPAGTATGSEGHDTLVGGEWTVEGSAFDDEITARTISAGDGDDVLHGTSDYYLHASGGDGTDTLDLDLLTHGADLSSYDGDLLDVETARLTPYDDVVDTSSPVLLVDGTTILAGAGADRIVLGRDPEIDLRVHGGSGDDVIVDGAGDNQLFGGGGDDLVRDGPGDDVVDGGRGTDRLRFFTYWATKPVRVDLRAQTAAGDSIGTDIARGMEDVAGTVASDVLLGSDQGEVLRAGAGSDIVRGRGGSDVLATRDGVPDDVYGGRGRDTCRRDRRDTVHSCP